jgi:SiaC family regulatory phosphoprotein
MRNIRSIVNWLRKFIREFSNPIQITFRLTYFNTPSSKSILEILLVLKDYEKKGGKVHINWYYPDDDLDLLAEAQDFIEDCKLSFNLIPYRLDY